MKKGSSDAGATNLFFKVSEYDIAGASFGIALGCSVFLDRIAYFILLFPWPVYHWKSKSSS